MPRRRHGPPATGPEIRSAGGGPGVCLHSPGGPWATARLGARPGPSRYQAVQSASDRAGNGGQNPGHGPGPGAGARRQPGATARTDAGQHDHGHAGLHRTGADCRPPQRGCPRRHLQPGLHAVLPACGQAAFSPTFHGRRNWSVTARSSQGPSRRSGPMCRPPLLLYSAR